MDQAARLTLLPTPEVRYPLRPEKPGGSVSYGGIVEIDVHEAGTYRLALDSAGNVWVTELSRNAILAIAPDGACHTVFEDPEGTVLRAPTDLAFGGADLRSVFVSSLKMSTLPVFTAPVPGLALRHWRNATRPAF